MADSRSLSLSRARVRLNLFLLLLVLTLAGLLVFSYRSDQQQTISGVAAEDIRQITVARAGELPFTLERSERGWYLAAPGVAAIAPQVQAELIAAGAAASLGQHKISDLDESAVGLTPPRVVVRINGTTRLEIGDRAPLSGLRYVRVGDTVHLIDDRHYHSVNVALADALDTRLLPTGSELAGIDVRNWHLHWDGTQWLDEGDRPTGEPDQLARAWSTAEAGVVGQLNPQAPRGDPLTLTITQPERTLEMDLIPAPDGSGIYLARRDLGVAFHFPADRIPPLPNPPAD